MEHSQLDFTAAGATNDFFHTFYNFISGKNILSNIFRYAAVGPLILLLVIILPCIVRILQQRISGCFKELKKGEMLGASVRNFAHGKGHEEGGFGIHKGEIEPQETPCSQASTPKTRVCLLYCFMLSPTPLTLRGADTHVLSRRKS